MDLLPVHLSKLFKNWGGKESVLESVSMIMRRKYSNALPKSGKHNFKSHLRV